MTRVRPKLTWRSTTITGIAITLVSALVLFQSRNAYFFYDEWNYLLHRVPAGTDALLVPYAGNLVAVHVATFQLLTSVFGLASYVPYQLTALLVHAAVTVLVGRYVATRGGPVAGVAASVIVLTLGPGYEPIIWAGAANHSIGLASMVAVLLLLDRQTRRADIVAACVLALGLATYGFAVAVLVGLVVEIILRRQPRRLIPLAVPFSLYALWLSLRPRLRGDYPSTESTLTFEHLDLIPGYVSQQLRAAAGLVIGQGSRVGLIILIAGIVLLAVHLRDRPEVARLAGLAVISGSTWILIALARAQYGEPESSRYLYTSVVLLLLLAAEVINKTFSPRVIGTASIIAMILATVANLPELRDRTESFNVIGQEMSARVTTLLLLDEPHRDFTPGRIFMAGATARTLTETEAELGHFRRLDLSNSNERERRVADSVFIEAQALRLRASAEQVGLGLAPRANDQRGYVTVDASCARLDGRGGTASIEITVPAEGITLQRPADAQARLLIGRYGPLGHEEDVPPGHSVFRPAIDRSAVPWRAKIETTGEVAVCGLQEGALETDASDKP